MNNCFFESGVDCGCGLSVGCASGEAAVPGLFDFLDIRVQIVDEIGPHRMANKDVRNGCCLFGELTRRVQCRVAFTARELERLVELRNRSRDQPRRARDFHQAGA